MSMTKTESIWTDDRVEELKQRMAERQSFLQIGNAFGCSRNAVAGKAFRLGLVSLVPRCSPATQLGQKPIQPQPVSPLATSLADLGRNDCRWVMGDPGQPDHGWCGQPVEIDKPYCPYHCSIAYR